MNPSASHLISLSLFHRFMHRFAASRLSILTPRSQNITRSECPTRDSAGAILTLGGGGGGGSGGGGGLVGSVVAVWLLLIFLLNIDTAAAAVALLRPEARQVSRALYLVPCRSWSPAAGQVCDSSGRHESERAGWRVRSDRRVRWKSVF